MSKKLPVYLILLLLISGAPSAFARSSHLLSNECASDMKQMMESVWRQGRGGFISAMNCGDSMRIISIHKILPMSAGLCPS